MSRPREGRTFVIHSAFLVTLNGKITGLAGCSADCETCLRSNPLLSRTHSQFYLEEGKEKDPLPGCCKLYIEED